MDNCVKGVSTWSVSSNIFMQMNNCWGFSTVGEAIGTHALSDTSLLVELDIQLRISSQHPDSAVRFESGFSLYVCSQNAVQLSTSSSMLYQRTVIACVESEFRLKRIPLFNGINEIQAEKPPSFRRSGTVEIAVISRRLGQQR